MFTLKHLKTLQHVSIIIQIIFRELICSLLKLLILKFVKNVKVYVVMRQHNIWCVYVLSVWRWVPDCSPAHIFTQKARVAAATPPNQQQQCILTDYFNNYNFSKLK